LEALGIRVPILASLILVSTLVLEDSVHSLDKVGCFRDGRTRTGSCLLRLSIGVRDRLEFLSLLLWAIEHILLSLSTV